MEPTSEAIVPESPKNNKTLIIAVVLALVLCCCCLVMVALAWTFGDAIVEMLGGL